MGRKMARTIKLLLGGLDRFFVGRCFAAGTLPGMLVGGESPSFGTLMKCRGWFWRYNTRRVWNYLLTYFPLVSAQLCDDSAAFPTFLLSTYISSAIIVSSSSLRRFVLSPTNRLQRSWNSWCGRIVRRLTTLRPFITVQRLLLNLFDIAFPDTRGTIHECRDNK